MGEDRRSSDERLVDLLMRAEEWQEQGRSFTVQQLCPEDPELWPELEELLAGFGQLQRLLPAPDPTPTHLPAAPPSAPLPPGALEGYEILEEIGRGGMGVVYKARQQGLNRLVALKVVFGGVHTGAAQRARFRREAEAVARLNHPNIVQVHEVGERDGVPFLCLEYVAGQNLAQHIAGRPQPHLQAALLVETLARAVHHAHQAGVVHRDLKPSNILLQGIHHKDTKDTKEDEKGRPKGKPGFGPSGPLGPLCLCGESFSPKITDFGLARPLDDKKELTGSGEIVGTPNYMAPEQVHGGGVPVGPAADVYALGVILYELLTGRPPFQGETPMDTVLLVVGQEPVPPSRLRPKLPRDLETICLHCLHKDPRRRYPTAEALADDLCRFLDGRPVTARPVGVTERFWRWCRRNPVVALLAAGVVLSLLGGAAVAWGFAAQALENAKQARQEAGRANESARRADDEKEETRKAKLLSDRRWYGAEMYTAQLEWNEGQLGLVRQRLETLLPKQPGDADLRGFEWHYRRRLFGLEIRSLRGHTDYVTCVAFSADGRRVASGSADKTIKVWDAVTGRPLRTFRPEPTLVVNGVKTVAVSKRVALSPDGRRVLATAGGPASVWDTDTGEQVAAPALPGDPVYSPDGRRLALCGATDKQGNPVLPVCDADTGAVVRTLPGGASQLSYSADGRRLACRHFDRSRSDLVKVWDTDTGKELFSLAPFRRPAAAVALSADGRRVAAASEEGLVRVWDVETGKETTSLQGRSGRFRNLAFSPGGDNPRAIGRRLADLGEEGYGGAGQVTVWDLGSGREEWVIRREVREGQGMAYSPDGRLLAVTGSFDHAVKLFDATAPGEFHRAEGAAYGVAFSPDGRTLASPAFDRGSVRRWDVAGFKERPALDGPPGFIFNVAYSPDGRRLAAGVGDNTVCVWYTGNGKVVQTLRPRDGAVRHRSTRVAYSPDGRRLAAGGYENGMVRVWDTDTGEEVLALRGHAPGPEGSAWCVAFSPDGRRLASGWGVNNVWGEVKVWDTAGGHEVFTLGGLKGFVLGVAFSPDGRVLAVPVDEGAVRLVDPDAGKEVLTLRGHAGAVRSVCFGSDGRRLVTGGHDGTVRIWDPATGQELLNLRMLRPPVNGVALSPDGLRIASVDDLHSLLLWDGSPPTDEDRARREAQGVVRNLFAAPLPRDEVLARIRKDATIGAAVRTQALELAATHPEDAFALTNAARATAVRPDAGAAEYRLALLRAEAACRLEPRNYLHLLPLGLAQYRLGRHEDALATMNQFGQRTAGLPQAPRALPLAVLALTQHRLGRTDAAAATLRSLREEMKKPAAARDVEAAALAQEAERLIAGDKDD
jgi:WD40 repeat protein/serine/threonine protein kinase